jgi:hypothetical protein
VHRSAVAPRVHIRADDPSVTPYAGLLLTGELLRADFGPNRPPVSVETDPLFRMKATPRFG